MTIIITMAGLGTRFRNAGYTIPKYQIEVHGKTLFAWSMLSLRGFSCRNYVFVVRKEDDSKEFIKKECQRFDIKATIIEIDHMTSGQAETAMLASAHWKESEPLLIYNIDTYIEEGAMADCDIKGDGFIPCFRGIGDHWSFVRLDEGGKALEVREKVRVSEFCTVGAYYFATGMLYQRLYKEFYLENSDRELEAGERYIAPLYNYLIQKYDGEVYISDIPTENVHVLGTPEEVEQFRKKV